MQPIELVEGTDLQAVVLEVNAMISDGRRYLKQVFQQGDVYKALVVMTSEAMRAAVQEDREQGAQAAFEADVANMHAQGRSVREIADAVNTPKTTVMRCIHRLIQRGMLEPRGVIKRG